MSTVATAHPSVYQPLPERLGGKSNTDKPNVPISAAAKGGAARGSVRPPATTVELSDRAKALLERSKIDQAV